MQGTWNISSWWFIYWNVSWDVNLGRLIQISRSNITLHYKCNKEKHTRTHALKCNTWTNKEDTKWQHKTQWAEMVWTWRAQTSLRLENTWKYEVQSLPHNIFDYTHPLHFQTLEGIKQFQAYLMLCVHSRMSKIIRSV